MVSSGACLVLASMTPRVGKVSELDFHLFGTVTVNDERRSEATLEMKVHHPAFPGSRAGVSLPALHTRADSSFRSVFRFTDRDDCGLGSCFCSDKGMKEGGLAMDFAVSI